MFSADLTKNGTSIPELVKRVREIAELTEPGAVVWCGGSDGEWELLTSVLVENGTFTRLNPELRPNSFYCASDPSDVARVEDRTFICSEREENAGPTNNWIAPDGLRETFAEIFDGCMRGRTMYVIPFCMGPLGSSIARLGVEITDSPYVAVSRRIMTRMGTPALRAIEETGSSVRAVYSVGAPLERGQADVPLPCNPVKYISHFPETREIWSYGSGYGGNALLGKKCYALRIDGKGRDWTADSPEPAAHPNARFTNPGRPVPDHRAAVGRPPRACRSRRSCSAAGGPAPVPLVIDPFAMLPFCGYNMGDYFGYWLRLDRTAADPAKLPRLFYVNWFRKNASGKFVWAGFGENIRVLKWIIQRLSGEAAALTTPVGYLPAPGSLDPGGLDISWADLELLLTVDTGAWKLEAEHIPEFFRTFGRHLPEQLWELHQELVDRLG